MSGDKSSFARPARLRRPGISALIIASVLMLPPVVRADYEPDVKYDARIAGYPDQQVTNLQDPGSSLSYVVLIVMSVICLGALFKDAKRTHLD